MAAGIGTWTNRALLGALGAALLVAGCSNSHPPAASYKIKPPPAPTVNVGVLRLYAETFDSVSAHIDGVAKALRGCVTPTAACRAAAASAGTAAVELDHHLRTDDSFREGDVNTLPLAPGISPLVVRTETDLRKIKRAERSASSGRAGLAALSKQMNIVAADIDAWEPGGQAAKAIASVHVTVPTVATTG